MTVYDEVMIMVVMITRRADAETTRIRHNLLAYLPCKTETGSKHRLIVSNRAKIKALTPSDLLAELSHRIT